MINYPTKKLSDLLETCDTGVWGKPAMSGKGLFVLRSTNMTNDGHLDFSDVAERKIEGNIKKLKLSDGDILVEKSGGGPDQPVGRVAHFTAPNDRAYSFANFIQRLRVKPKLIDSRFLFYRLLFLHKIGFTKKLQSQTTGIRNLKLSLYLKTEIPVPALNIQKQIVERLDKIAEAQKLNDDLIQKTNELFQSLLHQELNVASREWPLKNIGDMVNFSQIGLVRSKDKQSDNFEFNYIKMDNISLAGDLLLDKLVKVNAAPQEAKKFKLENGDFIFNTRNSPELVGKSTIFNIQNPATYLFNNNILRLRFKDKFMAEFINYYFHANDGIKKLNAKKRGTTSVSALYQGDLFNIRIPIPSLEIQKQIVAKLSAVQEYKTKLLAQKSKLKELFNSSLAKSFRQ